MLNSSHASAWRSCPSAVCTLFFFFANSSYSSFTLLLSQVGFQFCSLSISAALPNPFPSSEVGLHPPGWTAPLEVLWASLTPPGLTVSLEPGLVLSPLSSTSHPNRVLPQCLPWSHPESQSLAVFTCLCPLASCSCSIPLSNTIFCVCVTSPIAHAVTVLPVSPWYSPLRDQGAFLCTCSSA